MPLSLRFLLIMPFLLLQACEHNSEQAAEKAEKRQKRNDAASYNTQLGIAYLKQGDRPRAKRKLLIALDLAPDSPSANGAMAYYLEKTGNIEEAKKYYLKALSLSPQNGAQLNNYGTFLCRQGDFKEAEKYFIKAVNDVTYVHTAGAYENAGLCAEAVPDYRKAENYFIKALDQDPRRRQSLHELISVELKENELNSALLNLKKYESIVQKDKALLELALEVARKAGKPELEVEYKQKIDNLLNTMVS
ncbi:type IV pilus biogenesis/stability protein PilW [Legionella dresdenensis]|uniref:Type IV pilus biogenesis/stability protein PilW n=1 Tax=Legionella dresdenensis TaxID=450200 RepID=A0ABV8CBF6_9GAMM